MDGEGVYSWIDGTTFTGTFSNNNINGKGKLVLPSGICFEGKWKELRLDGIFKIYEGSVFAQYAKFKKGVKIGYVDENVWTNQMKS